MNRMMRLAASAIVALALLAGAAPSPARANEGVDLLVAPQTTAFALDSLADVGQFHSTDFKKIRNDLWYQVTKHVTVQWPGGVDETSYVRLEKLADDGQWVPVGKPRIAFLEAGETSVSYAWKIMQDTPDPVQYRFAVDASAAVTGGVSETFQISGELQTPGLKVKYSKKTQHYKKTPVALSITTSKAYKGSAAIYDGDTLLKTVKVTSGKASCSLPKKLKTGVHKITVVFTATAEFADFYSTQTSAVKKVKVVK
ncbi:MAG: hypothetical protein LBR32_03155 [Propionibacteriaceae bacterium]|nr:hypothetical protein [Propionibacteriaceae bacterium]